MKAHQKMFSWCVAVICCACAGAPTNAQAQTGACCFGGGQCEPVVSAADCTDAGGVYQGDNSECELIECAPAGACCFSDGECLDLSPDDCARAAGAHQGDSAVCAQMNCGTSLIGACCFPDGTCLEDFTGGGDCTSQGGEYQGDSTFCSSTECPQPIGACCFLDGVCFETDESDCTSQSGTYQGDGTTCNPCPQPGACCFNDGACFTTDQADCEGQGGTYQGNGTTCTSAPCPQPVNGACCFLDGSCFETDQADCDAQGAYQGDDTSCSPNSCPQPGACCFNDGVCFVTDQGDCTGQGGSYQGNDTTCNPNPCPQPGACCFNDGVCFVTDEGDCTGQGGSYQGDDVPCDPDPCIELRFGACCSIDIQTAMPFCLRLTPSECQTFKGFYEGDNTICSNVEVNGLVNGCGFTVTNDTCDAALPLMIPDTTQGTTINSTDDPELWSCFDDDTNDEPVGGGVWYTVIGNGEFLHASACPDFDGHIAVFCGSCEEPVCVDVAPNGNCPTVETFGGGGGGPESGGVGWCSAEGTLYYILVHASSADGMFELTITADGKPCEDATTCTAPSTNDDCETATRLLLGSGHVDSIAGASEETANELCQTLPGEESNVLGGDPGLWYTVNGNGNALLAEVTFPSGQEYRISVFCGECDNLICIDSSDEDLDLNGVTGKNSREVEWCSATDVTYTLLVQRISDGPETLGLGQDEFNITVYNLGKPCEPDIDCTPFAVAQDECKDAELVCPGIGYFDNTFKATPSSTDPAFALDCPPHPFYGYVDVWYRYVPRWSGDVWFVYHGVNAVPQEWIIGVYDNCGGADVDRIACNSLHTGFQMHVERGETYYIRLAKWYFDQGDFYFEVQGPDCLETPGDFNEDGIQDDKQCLNDVNDDQMVDFADFFQVVQAIGNCPIGNPLGNPCPEDVDYDGEVDIQDAMLVFAAFGRCPMTMDGVGEKLGKDQGATSISRN